MTYIIQNRIIRICENESVLTSVFISHSFLFHIPETSFLVEPCRLQLLNVRAGVGEWSVLSSDCLKRLICLSSFLKSITIHFQLSFCPYSMRKWEMLHG